jgi:hypothetical protein
MWDCGKLYLSRYMGKYIPSKLADALAIPKLMSGLGTSVKKCPKLKNEPNH